MDDYSSVTPSWDDLDGLDRDLIRRGVEARGLDLLDPAVLEIPTQHVVAGFVHQNDRPVPLVGYAVLDILEPVPQLFVRRVAPLQRDVGVGLLADDFARRARKIRTFAILDHRAVSGQARAFAETGGWSRCRARL
jgi:hypothetical protein